jgi:hypothetical protein
MTEQPTNHLVIDAATFATNYNIDVSNFVKVYPKGALEYIPWSAALMLMKQNHPTFVFEIEMFDGRPVLYLPDGTAFVSVIIVDTATGARSTASHYPVMKGFNHGAEVDPDCRAINDCIQRAKVKALAEVTGIGLKLWLRLEEDEISGEAVVSTRETKAPPSRRPAATARRQAPPRMNEGQEPDDYEEPEEDDSDEEYAEGDDEVFETEARQPLARRTQPATSRQPVRRPAATQSRTTRPAASRGANPFA